MTDIKHVLQDEIKRISRREIKAELEPLLKMITEQKSTIDALKKHIVALEKMNQENCGTVLTLPISEENENSGKKIHPLAMQSKVRETIKISKLLSFRKRNNLSQRHLAILLDVTPFSISHWEKGHNLPNQNFITLFKSIEKCKKRELYKMLEEKGINIKQEFRSGRREVKNFRSRVVVHRKRSRKIQQEPQNQDAE